jgi:uncharacterized protein
MSIYALVLEMKKLVRGVDAWVDKTVAFAATKKFDANTLLQTRLSPDMFPLVRQIQSVCDQATYAAGRTTGKDMPSHPNTETTFDELKKRIASVVAYLDGFSEADFQDLATRTVTTPRWEGKHMTATNYFIEHAQPNFFFHLGMTYGLLRHAGVEIGKRDYLGAITYI